MMRDEKHSIAHTGQQNFSTGQGRYDPALPARRNDEAAVVIWTPGFILLFALTIAVGLSATTILIQGWLNAHYSDAAALLAYMPLLFCLWLAVLLQASSPWARGGGLFGCLWSLFAAGNFWLHLPGADPQAPGVIYISIAANSALLGAFICLSLAHTPFYRWDSWFFRLLPAFTLLILLVRYLRAFQEVGDLQRVELASIPLLLYLCCAVWWLRPSCWHSQPGPTFLFGLAPLVLLVFVLPNKLDAEPIFFFQQLFLLCILLGALRVLQGELRRRVSTGNSSRSLDIDAMQRQD